MSIYNINSRFALFSDLLILFTLPRTSMQIFTLVVRSPPSETQGQLVGSGEKAERKFSSKGGRAPWYRLSPDHFQKFKQMPAPDWAQKIALYYCA